MEAHVSGGRVGLRGLSTHVGARRPYRNPSVTRMRFEGADKAAQARLLLWLHSQEL